MKILFLSLSSFDDVNVRGIYSDLMREFIKRDNDVYIASPMERRFGKPTHIIESPNCHILKIRTLNIQKTNIIEKGIGTLLLERQFDKAIRKYWGNVNFDLILYATPPITFNKVIERIKKRCGCRSYLMLKDIFPQNAVDLGMMKEGSILHRMFRRKEERLYEISDRIGCMSPANQEYVIRHNPSVNPTKVELCPNAVMPVDIPDLAETERNELLLKLGIPTDKTLFIYGGNLGKPQGIDFLLKVVEANEKNSNSHIIIVGSGTEYPKIQRWFDDNKPANSTLRSALPKAEYDKLIRACHVGLIFLDPRFTIPNFPSRLLSYLENRMPVLLATDPNTDMGRIAEREGFGLWSLSGDLDTFVKNMNKIALDCEIISEMGVSGKQFLLKNYTADKIADIIQHNRSKHMDSSKIPIKLNEAMLAEDYNQLKKADRNKLFKDNILGAVGCIPIIGAWVSGAASGTLSYSDSALFRKIFAFIYGLKDTTLEQRSKFIEEVESTAKDVAGNVLSEMINRMDNINKATFMANLVKAKMNGEISIEDFFRLSAVCERIPYADLCYLKQFEKEAMIDGGVTEILYASGALIQCTISDDENKYTLSVSGRKLLKYGLFSDVNLEIKNATQMPNMDWGEY